MQHVLLLTKNSLFEGSIVERLQRLNYETLCSTDLIHHLEHPTTAAFLSYFQWVVLGDSICHYEAEKLLQQLKNYPIYVLRVVEEYPNEEEQDVWRRQGLSDWLVKDASFEALREKLSSLKETFNQEMTKNHRILTFPSEVPKTVTTSSMTLVKSLSKKERKVFEYLLKSYTEGIVLSRTELCEYLWNDGDTPSNMSQLSCLINKLKRKFELHGVTVQAITTKWGQGYQLSDEFYDYWIQCTEQDNPVLYYSNSN